MQGRTLAGRYRLDRQLGQGGMGSVWVAEHLELGTPTAVKLMDPRIADDEAALARFKREAQAAATIRSTHVVQILDYGVDDGTPFIVMELLEGESLEERLNRVGTLTPEETATIMTQVARAVHKAHEIGVVHRDLKPDNIFIVHEDDAEITKVLDFGIAKETSDVLGGKGMQTQTGALLGTPAYMSPEQTSGKHRVDHRTDIWAVGVIAYECMTGRLPFESDLLGGLVLAICTEEPPPPSSVAPVPGGFDAWFAQATAKVPDARFGSVREAAKALRQVCAPRASRDWLDSVSEVKLPSTSAQQALEGTSSAAAAPAQRVSAWPIPLVKNRRAKATASTQAQLPPSTVTVRGQASGAGGKLLLGVGALLLVGAAAGAAMLWGRGWMASGVPESAASSGAADPTVSAPEDDLIAGPIPIPTGPLVRGSPPRASAEPVADPAPSSSASAAGGGQPRARPARSAP